MQHWRPSECNNSADLSLTSSLVIRRTGRDTLQHATILFLPSWILSWNFQLWSSKSTIDCCWRSSCAVWVKMFCICSPRTGFSKEGALSSSSFTPILELTAWFKDSIALKLSSFSPVSELTSWAEIFLLKFSAASLQSECSQAVLSVLADCCFVMTLLAQHVILCHS